MGDAHKVEIVWRLGDDNLQDLRMPYTPICEWYGNSQNFKIRSWLSMGVHIFSEIPRLTYAQTFTFPVCLLIFLTSDLMWLKWTFQLNDTPSLTHIQSENIYQILRISRYIISTNPTSSLHPSRGYYVAIWYYEQHLKRNVDHYDLKYITHCTSYSKVFDCMYREYSLWNIHINLYTCCYTFTRLSVILYWKLHIWILVQN